MVLRRVGIPTLSDRERILTLRGSILELSVRKVGIWESGQNGISLVSNNNMLCVFKL